MNKGMGAVLLKISRLQNQKTTGMRHIAICSTGALISTIERVRGMDTPILIVVNDSNTERINPSSLKEDFVIPIINPYKDLDKINQIHILPDMRTRTPKGNRVPFKNKGKR